jgi:hypothetical protein
LYVIAVKAVLIHNVGVDDAETVLLEATVTVLEAVLTQPPVVGL